MPRDSTFPPRSPRRALLLLAEHIVFYRRRFFVTLSNTQEAERGDSGANTAESQSIDVFITSPRVPGGTVYFSSTLGAASLPVIAVFFAVALSPMISTVTQIAMVLLASTCPLFCGFRFWQQRIELLVSISRQGVLEWGEGYFLGARVTLPHPHAVRRWRGAIWRPTVYFRELSIQWRLDPASDGVVPVLVSEGLRCPLLNDAFVTADAEESKGWQQLYRFCDLAPREVKS